jgi:hypothetical protein
LECTTKIVNVTPYSLMFAPWNFISLLRKLRRNPRQQCSDNQTLADEKICTIENLVESEFS